MSVLNPKGGNIVWNFVKDNIIEVKEDYSCDQGVGSSRWQK